MCDAQPMHDRKRKAADTGAEDDDIAEPLIASVVDSPNRPPSMNVKAPRLSATSPTTSWSTKRATSSRKRPRRLSTLPSSSMYDLQGVSPSRVASDIEDFGWTLEQAQAARPKADDFAVAPAPVEALRSPLIPPLIPVVNQQTLKELDMEAMLRNSQLRHDIVHDSTLQFRTSYSHRKQEAADRYWNAVLQELNSGCTCITVEVTGRNACPLACECSAAPGPFSHPHAVFRGSRYGITLRMPSRIRPLLSEFLEVMLLVTAPATFMLNGRGPQKRVDEHCETATQLRSILDPALIEQEITQNVFDPTGLFKTISSILKANCAPMRDAAIDAMLSIALSPSMPGKERNFKAIKGLRMCLEILELMKLDMANHELVALRPYLVRNAGQHELRVFTQKVATSQIQSMRLTQEWIQRADSSLFHRSLGTPHMLLELNYASMTRSQRISVSVVKGLVDLIFEPPIVTADVRPPPKSLADTTSLPALTGYPETLHLDIARLPSLMADAADVMTMYTFLLLYRQLLHTDVPGLPRCSSSMETAASALIRIKTEVRDIATAPVPSRHPPDNSTRHNLVLQIAMHAQRDRLQSSRGSVEAPHVPCERLLSIASKWSDMHILGAASSSLSALLRTRLRDAVFCMVLASTHPNLAIFKGRGIHSDSDMMAHVLASFNANSSMEPLAEEIRLLSDKLRKLSTLHLNAYVPLYEQAKFVELSSSS